MIKKGICRILKACKKISNETLVTLNIIIKSDEQID